MSIKINLQKCIGCKKCIDICPGNLIKEDSNGKAFIKEVKDCWGCTSCIKECNFSAIEFFLGEDIGGTGGKMIAEESDNKVKWIVETQKEVITVEVDKNKSNSY